MQMTFASLGAATGFERHGKTTKRAAFLAEMDRVVPRQRLCRSIEPHCPKPGAGRPPIPLERMLRIHFLQHRFNLSDPGMEETLYDSATMRAFAGIDLGREPAPDETAICRFRHLLETHALAQPLFNQALAHLEANGIEVATGTIASTPPSSTRRPRPRTRRARAILRCIGPRRAIGGISA
jgi:IS5 family transposase